LRNRASLENWFSFIYMICYIENSNDFITVFAEERIGHPCLAQQDIGLSNRAQPCVEQPCRALFLKLLHRDPARGHPVDDQATFFHLCAANRAKHFVIPPIVANSWL